MHTLARILYIIESRILIILFITVSLILWSGIGPLTKQKSRVLSTNVTDPICPFWMTWRDWLSIPTIRIVKLRLSNMSSLKAECGMMRLCSSSKNIARLRFSVIMQFLLPEI